MTDSGDALSESLVGAQPHRHLLGHVRCTEADAAAIREVYERDGELSAAIELRRRFPGIVDNTKARAMEPPADRPGQRLPSFAPSRLMGVVLCVILTQ